MRNTYKKITVQIPEQLLDHAIESSGMGITQTISQGLKLVAASHAYEKLKSLRGKVKFRLNLKKLREDRS